MSGDDGKEDRTITVTVLRSSSAENEEFQFSLDQPLKDLKTAIAQSARLGRIQPQDQRLFHMGRELKTGGRSLERLGVGKFGINVIHVHTSVPGYTPQQLSNRHSGDVEVACDDRRRPNDAVQPAQRQQGNSDVVDLADSDGEDSEVEVVEQPGSRARRAKRHRTS